MRMTIQQLEKLKQEGKIPGYSAGKKVVRPVTAAPQRSKEKEWIDMNLQYWCDAKKIDLKREHRFHASRKWRFDWSIPEMMVAFEYEGIFSRKSRHTTVKGFTGDLEKYNAAQVAGWRVLRFTALNYQTVLQQLNNIKLL